MLEVINKRIVVTRKSHTCFGCENEIEKGKSAVYVNAKEDEQRTQFHLHEECNKMIMKDLWFAGGGLYRGCIKDARKRSEDANGIKFSPDEELPFPMKFNKRAEA
ncbi:MULTISPECIES: hypothetical protein [unclassified Lysinibacillus]|uniref:hypothetical protein n=1 Tax=unclassified Lysinibacillus TaxID=2636778 RepID=UPI00201B42AF|nr:MULTISPECIES: hypothetical protein [unclassified Lysinibacillus]